MLPHIVLDTNVLFSAFHSRIGASFALFDRVVHRQIKINLSVPLLLEYEDILNRDAARIGLTDSDVTKVLNALCLIGQHHKIHYLWRPILPDPKDDLLLELAVSARCPFIVSHNRRHLKGTESFGIQAIGPLQFLDKIGVRL